MEFDDDCMGNINLNDVIHYSLGEFSGGFMHGITHWENVDRNGMRLANNMTEGVNKRVVRLFSYLHDHQRNADGYDTEHGPRAAEALFDISNTLLEDLSEEEFEMLYEACKIHTVAKEPTGNPTIDCCIDADRLDLPRVGITPDPDRMLTEAGKKLAEEEW
ncbi:MAG: hypothetical protein Q4B64_10740 [Spirochaetales bacterium]|nr:hypothetical protein [Spirochaetales bacterium]